MMIIDNHCNSTLLQFLTQLCLVDAIIIQFRAQGMPQECETTESQLAGSVAELRGSVLALI